MLEFGIATRLNLLGLAWLLDPSTLDLATMSDSRARVKKFKIFQQHDWTAKTNIASFTYDFSFICSRT
jgi:hypothetical protein